MDWYKLAKERESELVTELQQLIQINSTLDESTASDDAPFGKGPLEALQFMLQKGKEQGFTVKNIDNYAGHIEIGQGEDLVGILCHVDVVPAGDGWTYPPFEGRIVDGKIYGRGALDDKGPTMAAWLAMKLVSDMNIHLFKRVRLILGTDEETGFRCVDHYFQKEEMPTTGFSPDGDFPLINAEKGIAELSFNQTSKMEKMEQLLSFNAGRRINMVPDEAIAKLTNVDETIEWKFKEFQKRYPLHSQLTKVDGTYIIKVEGKSAHAMEPHKGINAAVKLAEFLLEVVTTKGSLEFLTFLVNVFGANEKGEYLQIHYEDAASGPMTLNAGVVSFDDEKGGEILVSMRYSVTFPFEQKMTHLMTRLSKEPFTVDVVSNSAPHFVPEEDELVQKLLTVYRKYTGDYSKPIFTGGGTYARVMKKGVAFGMLFPGDEDLSHQKDEHITIESLLKASAIYAEAIVQLAGK